jgi:hypothetical protein
MTHSLEGCCSIQLSYRKIVLNKESYLNNRHIANAKNKIKIKDLFLLQRQKQEPSLFVLTNYLLTLLLK